MTGESTTPFNERDEARTPPSLFKKLDERFHFDLDAAATIDNRLCQFCWTTEIDSLRQDWDESIGRSITTVATKIFHQVCMKASEWIIFEPRVKFLRPNGIPFEGSPKFGSFACVFKQDEFDGSPLVSSMRWK